MHTPFQLAAAILLIFWLYGLEAHEADEHPRLLHLTFHKGCQKEFEGVAEALHLNVETWFIPDLPNYFLDGVSHGNSLYNIGHDRAQRIWDLHQKTFETFDMILVSDTAPLSRIFLQNHWSKPLIIWICNRFDYTDKASLDCHFPDEDYYELFKQACTSPTVTMIAYTEFEHYYAKLKGIETGSLTITPCGLSQKESLVSSLIPPEIIKEETFFLPPYHNEKHFMNLSSFLKSLGISNFCGRYNGNQDLRTFKGIIHLPYSWSNLDLFENMQMGIPYFIPSSLFLEHLVQQGNYFHPDLPLLTEKKLYELSEWYTPKNQEALIYFDSWEDLVLKIQETDFGKLRQDIRHFAQQYQDSMLKRWQAVFDKYTADLKKEHNP